jgi:uncharacterized Zn-binding protein involved in type VI secretion
MAAPVLQFKRGLLANLPGLRVGEPGFTTDSYDLYVGIDSSTNNNKFFGSHRYWTKGTASTGSGVNLVEGTSNGTSYLTLKSPDSLAGIVTYTLPGTQGATSSVLTNDGSGNLTWSSGSANPVFTGIATFSDGTDNTLGDADTGAVQINGGLGINKNVTVGGNLNVQGYSEFVGVVTFKGGTINIGDSNTDDINVAGEFISNLVPNADNTYDIGIGGKRWRSANFSGVSTFNNVTVGGATTALLVQGNTRIIGILTVGTASLVLSGVTNTITGITTFTDFTDFNAGIDVSGAESTFSSATVSDLTAGRVVLAGTSGSLEDSANLTFGAGGLTVGANGLNVTGVSTFSTDVVVGGDLRLNGNDIKASDGNTNISLTSNTLTSFAGDIKVGGNDIQASDGNVNITMTSNTLTEIKGDLKVTGNDIQSSSATALTLSGADVTVAGDLTVTGNDIKSSSATALTLSGADVAVAGDLTVTGNDIKSSSATSLTLSGADVTVAGDLTVTGNDIKSSSATALTLSGADVTVAGDLTVGGNDIKANDGTTALTLANTTGAVTAANDLTVQGNLYVNGNTTQVNTSALTVEDRTIDLGIVNGAAPASSTTWDLGILFNYNSSGAKKSAVIWEHGDTRFKFASVLGADTDGTDANTPQLTVTTFAPIEIGALWVTDCAGTSQVVSCTGTERFLENITVDGGQF